MVKNDINKNDCCYTKSKNCENLSKKKDWDGNHVISAYFDKTTASTQKSKGTGIGKGFLSRNEIKRAT